MTSNDPRQRKLPAEPNTARSTNDRVSQKRSSHIYEQEPANYGVFIQIVRSVVIVAWFLSCCCGIVVTQLAGVPLYFINRRYFNSYIAMTKRLFGLTVTALTQWCSPTPIRVSGDKSVQGQFGVTNDGRLQTYFPERLVLISNHQVYTDWLYLWWVSYTNKMHGHIYIILKESLKYIPVIGQGMMLYGFIFMARRWLSDKPRLQHRLEKLKTRHKTSSGATELDPMWLLMFPEGTNLSPNTKRISDAYGRKQGLAPFEHQILPRSTGLYFCLQQLRGTVDWVYDCTMGYEGPPKGRYPDTFFTLRSTYLECRPPKVVNFYWRRFALSEIPLDDPKEFEAWLYKRWGEKDKLLHEFNETGMFPSFEQKAALNGKDVNGKRSVTVGSNEGYIESDIRLVHWFEVFKIFGASVAVTVLILIIPRFWR